MADTILCNLSTMGDIMIHVGDIMSTVGGVQYRGVTQITEDLFPHGTEHPYGTHDIPQVHYDIPHSTEYPPRYTK